MPSIVEMSMNTRDILMAYWASGSWSTLEKLSGRWVVDAIIFSNPHWAFLINENIASIINTKRGTQAKLTGKSRYFSIISELEG
jgi:hypothetical protein